MPVGAVEGSDSGPSVAVGYEVADVCVGESVAWRSSHVLVLLAGCDMGDSLGLSVAASCEVGGLGKVVDVSVEFVSVGFDECGDGA